METVLSEKLIDLILSNFDKKTAIRILIAVKRAERLYNEYQRIKSQWNHTLSDYLQSLIEFLEHKNYDANKLKQIFLFCEELKMSEDYVIKLIKQAKRCKNSETRALIVAKIIDYFAPREDLNAYAIYISKLSEIINKMKSSLEENVEKG